MTDLKIARGFTLPRAYITKTAAILAKKRIGKTYNASVIAEEFVAAGLPFVALDPTSAWWGLRADRTGERDGLPVTIIGGEHGDLPLDVGSGKVIADLVVEEPGFYVVDLGHWESDSEHRRWAAPFLDRLYRHKAKRRDPLHLFIDEADVFAPQKPQKGDEQMLHNMQAIVRRGGIRGLGTTLITQRAAVLNKDVLTQLDLLIILRTIAPQDQDAVEDYVKRGASSQRAEIMASLASLKPGEAWIYGPGEEPPITERVQFRTRRTFNSSATPEEGDVSEPKRMAPVDIEKARRRLAESIERAKAEDPKALRRRIKELEAKLAQAGPSEEDLATSFEQGKRYAEVEARDAVRVVLEQVETHAAHALDEMRNTIDDFMQGDGAARSAPPGTEGVHSSAALPESTASRRQTAEPEANGGSHTPSTLPAGGRGSRQGPDVGAGAPSGSSTLPRAAADLAETLAAFPDGLPRERLALLTGRKPRGGSWNTAMKALQELGIAEDRGDVLIPTAKARELYPSATPLAGAELVQVWRAKLGIAARDVFDALVADGGALTHEELGERTDRAPRGGSWNTAIKQLKTSGLVVEEGRGALRPNPDLMVSA